METTEQSIKRLIEERLQAAQQNKEFKDVGRKSGTRKERVAYSVISIQNLSDIEQDAVMAQKLVTKAKVWPPLDIQAEKDAGHSAGATYLKAQYQRALAQKPYNSPETRKIYVNAITIFRAVLDDCTNAEEVKTAAYEFWKIDNLLKIHPELIPAQRNYFSSSAANKRAETIFGKAFLNLVRGTYGSGAAAEKIRNASLYDPFSQEAADAYAIRFNEGTKNSIAQTLKDQAEVMALDNAGRIAWINRTFTRAEDKRANPEDVEARLNRYFIPRIKQLEQRTIPTAYLARGNDWSWSEIKVERKVAERNPDAIQINRYPFSKTLLRKNGVQMPDITDSGGVRNLWGLSSVQYGNSLKDTESAMLARLLNGALMDLEEATGLNLNKIHQSGKLGVDFATRGIAGSAATYWPAYRVINLNKRNGDGSLNHEWGHFLDNFLAASSRPETETYLAGQLANFATEHKAENEEINDILKEWRNFMHQGNGTEEITIPVIGKKYKLVLGSGFVKKEETLQLSVYKYLKYKDSKYWNLLLGDLVYQHFGEGHQAEVTLPIGSSFVFYNSKALDGSGNTPKKGYWQSNVEMFARCWEKYIVFSLQRKGIQNNFLQPERKGWDSYGVYPEGKELEHIARLFDKLLDAIKRTYAAHSVTDFNKPRVDVEIPNPTLSEKAEKSTEKPTAKPVIEPEKQIPVSKLVLEFRAHIEAKIKSEYLQDNIDSVLAREKNYEIITGQSLHFFGNEITYGNQTPFSDLVIYKNIKDAGYDLETEPQPAQNKSELSGIQPSNISGPVVYYGSYIIGKQGINQYYFNLSDITPSKQYQFDGKSLIENVDTNRKNVIGKLYTGNGTVQEAIDLLIRIQKLPETKPVNSQGFDLILETPGITAKDLVYNKIGNKWQNLSTSNYENFKENYIEGAGPYAYLFSEKLLRKLFLEHIIQKLKKLNDPDLIGIHVKYVEDHLTEYEENHIKASNQPAPNQLNLFQVRRYKSEAPEQPSPETANQLSIFAQSPLFAAFNQQNTDLELEAEALQLELDLLEL